MVVVITRHAAISRPAEFAERAARLPGLGAQFIEVDITPMADGDFRAAARSAPGAVHGWAGVSRDRNCGTGAQAAALAGAVS